MATPSMSSGDPVFRFYIHAASAFPWPTSQAPSKEATKAWSKSPVVARILERLPDDEQAAVTRFFHPADASRCLCSLLLKHIAIMHGAKVPFSCSTITQQRDIRNGKPFYAPRGVEFNVSHHGDYVVCIGTTIPNANVGIDIVQIDVEKDSKRMGKDGFVGWVDMFSDILSEKERRDIVQLDEFEGVEAGLRRFYTVWACKEAYIKLTSDALMATWLRELEFPEIVVPEPAALFGEWGQPVSTTVRLQGANVEEVKIELVGLGLDYIVASAIDHSVTLPVLQQVRISEDGSGLNVLATSAGGSIETWLLKE